jgi:predicted small lipoprotein YifL
MKTIRRLLPMLLVCALLAACGNKGDLVRPEPAAATPSSTGAAAG